MTPQSERRPPPSPSSRALGLLPKRFQKRRVSSPAPTGDLRHGGILPDHNLVLTVSMCGDNLVRVLRPGQVAHLASRIHLVDDRAFNCVMEYDATIRRAASRCE
ncbi:hypothetical protein HYQ46_001841 [Verticillium longisporum]|nr:hypothetical protein HYQ46_001841 [Verticillium longisporum]